MFIPLWAIAVILTGCVFVWFLTRDRSGAWNFGDIFYVPMAGVMILAIWLVFFMIKFFLLKGGE